MRPNDDSEYDQKPRRNAYADDTGWDEPEPAPHEAATSTKQAKKPMKRKRKKREVEVTEEEEESEAEEDKNNDDEDKEAQDIKEARVAMKEAAQWLANEGRRARKKNSRYS